MFKNQWTKLEILSSNADLLLLIEAFLLDRKAQNLSKGTIYFYQKKLQLFSKFCDGQVISSIAELSPDVLRKYLLWLEQTGHNAGGVHACYRVIKTFLLWVENEFEPDNWRNPIHKIKSPHVPVQPLEGITTDNFQKLIDICDKRTFYGLRDRAILMILLDCGIRASELTNLDLNDFDILSGSLLIRSGKGRKVRTIFAGRSTRKSIRSFLKKHCSLTGSLFTSHEGNKLSYFGLREIVKRLSKKAGIAPPSLHDFRRSFALTL